MTEKMLITIVCPHCKGKGWTIWIIPPYGQRAEQTCRECHGLGVIRKKIKAFQVHISVKKQKQAEAVKQFMEKYPDRWRKIQRKYRKSEPIRERLRNYMRIYMKVLRANLKGKKVPVLCVQCKQHPIRRWARDSLCIACLINKRKPFFRKNEPMTTKEVKELRDVEKWTFSEIGRKFGVSRQYANLVYHGKEIPNKSLTKTL